MKVKMYDSPQPLEMYLNKPLECSCGRTHFAPIKAVRIGPDVLDELPEYVRKYGYSHPLIVSDSITYKIAGKRCAELLAVDGIDALSHQITHMGFDEATLGELIVNIPVDCDVIIAVGTGSISDIIRYFSYKLHLPCITVATAAPMDGFAASIGILNVNNLKATMQAHTSELIFGETDTLKSAPYNMIVAGLGDLLGKLSCLNDWKLSQIINGEHYCEKIAQLVEGCVRSVLRDASRVRDRDAVVVERIMSGLVLSGVAISLYGDSRPASGSEHHMSHYWETIMEQQGKSHAMHGIQVAVGTVMMLMLQEEILNCNIDFDAARRAAHAYDRAEWESEIRSVYGSAAQEVIEMENSADKNGCENRLKRIDAMQQRWGEITAQIETLPTSEELIDQLRSIGCACTPVEIEVDDELLKNTFMYCKEIRPRYTALQMAYDLDILDSLSDKVIARLKTMV